MLSIVKKRVKIFQKKRMLIRKRKVDLKRSMALCLLRFQNGA